MHLSTFSRRLLHTPSSSSKKKRSCQRLHRFLSHFCAYLLDSSPAKAEQHNLFNCRLTIDALAAFTINYGSVESSAEFHYAAARAKPARLQEQLHEGEPKLQIEFKRLGRLFYGNCAPNDINFSLLHRPLSIIRRMYCKKAAPEPINLN